MSVVSLGLYGHLKTPVLTKRGGKEGLLFNRSSQPVLERFRRTLMMLQACGETFKY